MHAEMVESATAPNCPGWTLERPDPRSLASSACEWLECLPAIAWRTDEHALIIDRNRHWFEYTGRPRDTATGTDWLEVIHPDDGPLAASAVQRAIATGGPLDAEFRVRRADGVYRWFLARAAPVRDASGHVSGWMGIATDIEDQKRAEQALREADRRKNEFLGVLSHELRNPLAPLSMAAHILERTEPAGPQARMAREIIARQIAHLGRLVDDLLDVTRIIRGKIELRQEAVDLVEVVRSTAEDHLAVMDQQGLRFSVELPDEPAVIDGDATRVAQMVGNLLHNAAKFTDRDGWVRLWLVADRTQCAIHVQDSGIGMSADLLTRIFEPFTQGPQGLARTAGGLGLGLALVKGLAELHGGSVEAHSEGPGRGSELTIVFPRRPPVPGHARSGAAGSATESER